jgi:hypothetical protein
MLIVNFVAALVVAILTGLWAPQTCVTSFGMHVSSSGSSTPVLEYRSCSSSFGPADTFIFGLLLFVALTILEMSLNTSKLLRLRRAQSVIWRADDEATTHIHNILVHMRQVASSAYGKHDRYLRYFLNEIVTLENKLREAADRKDLVVPSDEFQSPEDIEGAFKQGSKERVFSYTWPIDSAGSVFTTAGWRYFFDLTLRVLADETLTGVRALLILSDASLLRSQNVQRLLAFYSTTENAEAKAVTKSDFEAIAGRIEVPEDWVDFGIYDNSLLYVTENGSGRFTKDEFRIELYLRLFDTIWNSAGMVIAASEGMPPGDSISLTQLLELDAGNSGSQVQLKQQE